MKKIKTSGHLEISQLELVNSNIYTDRNGVYHKAKGDKETIINALNIINKENFNKLKVITNESEDPKKSVIEVDKKNGINLKEENYKLSTESAGKFILENLNSDICYYVGGKNVENDINNMGLNTINLSNKNMPKDLIFNIDEDIPILFARPPFAINSRFNNDEEIMSNIQNDKSFDRVKYIINNSNSKIVFCHTKPNCERKNNGIIYRELNLGFYFDYLVTKYGLQIGDRIFDLGKGGSSKGEFFDISLSKNNKNYKNVIGIGDMLNDIEYVIQNGGKGILVESGDQIFDEQTKKRIKLYSDKLFTILNLSFISIN